MKQKRLIAIILCFSVVFFSVFVLDAPKAKAWAISAAIANLIPEAGAMLGTWADYIATAARWVADKLGASSVVAYKVIALLAVQQATKAIIGGRDGDTVIRDYGDYLYTSAEQQAVTQINSFFNTVSKGRLSSTNYEGVGPNYDAYLVAQARQSIAGQSFTTDLQETVTDASQMFSGGNMKGLLSYMQCANNVACFTLTAKDQYDKEYAKAQDIARSEQQNGFLPRKKNGRITSPALLAQSALTQMDQLGTEVIMNAQGGTTAETVAAYTQITEGAAISIGARAANYYMSDDEGKQAIRDKNNEFPFSLAYSATGGIGFSAGGTIANIGYGTSSNLQIGNTCASSGFVVDARGAAVEINGKKTTCATCANSGGTCQPICSGTKLTITNSGCKDEEVCCK
jgi:hypothetical protein